jgi:plastocyanin
MKHPTKLLLFLCATSPALLGAKCVEYDPRFGGASAVTPPQEDTAAAAPVPEAGAPATDVGSATPEAAAPVFTPGKACAQAKAAIITVKNRQFIIDCGCEETTGKVCTVPAGTTVRWAFADSTEHNVSGSMLGPSGENLTGNWESVFDKAGSYKYGCSIHRDMRDYSIVVK